MNARGAAWPKAMAFEPRRNRLDGTPLVRPKPGSKKSSKQASKHFNTDFTEKKIKPQSFTEKIKNIPITHTERCSCCAAFSV
jgi:hypothetical protein